MSDNQLPKEQMLFNGQYLVIKKLGQGGFGIVWEAFDFSLKNFVAIKELLKEYAEVRFVEMFYKEALMAKNLIHDNIVRVQHFWKGDNGSYYIVMDYVLGRDLGLVLKKCSEKGVKLPWELSIFICGGVLKALDYSNRLAKDTTTGKPYGIVYRDVSPGNVMVFFDGNIKISDFGIAKTAEELSRKSKQKIVTGKYAYMSPEQISGDSNIDHRSDIFSVGILLYEMLTGEQLFTGDVDAIRKQVTDAAINLEPLKKLGLPDELGEIIAKALKRDKTKRYQAALEMFRDLRRLLKFKETEELQSELSTFICNILVDEILVDNKLLDWVRQLNLQDIKMLPEVNKISCKDFIMGEADVEEEYAPPPPAPQPEPVEESEPETEPAPEIVPETASEPVEPLPKIESEPVLSHSEEKASPEAVTPPAAEKAPEQKGAAEDAKEIIAPSKAAAEVPAEKAKPEAVKEKTIPPKVVEKAPAQKPKPEPVKAKTVPPKTKEQRPAEPRAAAVEAQGEERGKTVFEEVGDWFSKKFKVYKKRLITVMAALVVTAVLLVVVDTFARVTPFGKNIYSRIYPPDTVITTVPSGARVSLKTRDNTFIISEADSTYPIELRKVVPQSYILTAYKEGFKPIEKIVTVEEKGSIKGSQRIDVVFEFTLNVFSEPAGADVVIDGNKYGVTPWKGDLVAGEHTVKLTLKGFDNLGSDAKEAREGQCSLDFTQSDDAGIFGGIDTKYWKYDITSQDGAKMFNVYGTMFRRVKIDSSPQSMAVYVGDEKQSKGNTPLALPMKPGEYRVTFADPNGLYENTARTLKVDAIFDGTISATLKKYVRFKVAVKGEPAKAVSADLKITGNGINLTKNISSNSPERIALPLGVYKAVFDGGKEFRPVTVKDINISQQSTIAAELEYVDSELQVNVKEEGTGKIVAGAYVWMDGRIMGKTDDKGTWKNTVKFGSSTIRIVANGYDEKFVEAGILPGKLNTVSIELHISQPPPAASDQPVSPAALTGDVIQTNKSIFTGSAIKDRVVKPAARPVPSRSSDTSMFSKEAIKCSNCGKEYPAGSRKLRFCINCGKTLKWE
ncbi:MAG TPA: hypothetical protein DEE98_04500 [Elusimicrobia bacterium]|nr:MAG: hypothetical protein A2278_04195 [Elusimicrobia bacterium RIFOXYA12_FULL_49_49]OGS14747.1 MAG: hypothetical protein A2251_09650 [Elusimicrobia bacterium RIFOXYA2_FULL_47_53]OGS25602.1 MAG: hypothetical protein A2339_05945 [Elusimicrobia bacterium RIFOXYB12_FULL_50_12]OGS30115.1 MAG: hypothetical protein A2323_01575 [Elusimicrobia bacterium RIFOXYB2_FULL_46_23]HBU69627.1 hypothetical protein [Elusimicrobiota bacterium]